MGRSLDKKRSKLNIILWITLPILAETLFVFWPLVIVLVCMGLSAESISVFVVSGLGFGLVVGLGGGLGVFAGVPIGVLLRYGVKELGKGGIEAVKQFFTPWRSERLYFGRSVGFFAIIYLGFVLLFALWFYASYLNANKVVGVWLSPPNPYFNVEHIIGVPNYWTFIYFSFITIASLGYGDIFPTHWFSQILVILETMVGVGLIAGFLAMIITVGSRGKRKIKESDFDADIDY